MKNDVWEIVSRQERNFFINLKWMYNIKHTAYGSIDKYREISIAQGFSQKEGIDYKETFSPMVR